jgi:hypothetical protein
VGFISIQRYSALLAKSLLSSVRTSSNVYVGAPVAGTIRFKFHAPRVFFATDPQYSLTISKQMTKKPILQQDK